jgi:hypothetical protein
MVRECGCTVGDKYFMDLPSSDKMGSSYSGGPITSHLGRFYDPQSRPLPVHYTLCTHYSATLDFSQFLVSAVSTRPSIMRKMSNISIVMAAPELLLRQAHRAGGTDVNTMPVSSRQLPNAPPLPVVPCWQSTSRI